VALATTGPNGGTIQYATILNPLSAFAGASTLVDQYEQFRIDRIRVYARSDSTNIANLAAPGRFPALYGLANYSTIATFVDYDSFSAPTEASFLGRDAMKIRALSPGTFRLIANYAPRCRLSDATNNLPALVPHQQTTWISTDFSDLDWLGLNVRCTQDSPYWGIASNNAAKVQFFIKASVSFRGLKKENSSTVAISNLPDPTVLTLASYPDNIKYTGDILSEDEAGERENETL